MNYLLDTNVLSESGKPRPDRFVVQWLAEVDEDRVFISVISLTEIRRGIELMASDPRRDRLSAWLVDELTIRFDDRVLPIDGAVAEQWGTLMARAQRLGIGLSTLEAFLAATAEIHNLTLVTRNTADFAQLGISRLNPWHPPR